MKPPEVHHPVKPPSPNELSPSERTDDVQPPEGVAADTGREAHADGSIDRQQGLVGDFGPIVDRPAPDVDGAAEEERRRD